MHSTRHTSAAARLTEIERLASTCPVDIEATRGALDAARAALFADLQRTWPSAGAACRRLTAIGRAVCRGLFAGAPGPRGALAALAVGGFGRDELCPGSDLDLLIAYDDAAVTQEQAAAVAEPLVRSLWDLGLEPAPSVRPLANLPETLAADLATTTALASASHLAGDAAVTARVRACVAAHLTEQGIDFLGWKLSELDRLHKRYGASPFRLAPHVKAGAGGLRDLELLALFGRAGAPPVGLGALAGQEAALTRERLRLLDLRFALHLAAGRAQDRLHLETWREQPAPPRSHADAPRVQVEHPPLGAVLELDGPRAEPTPEVAPRPPARPPLKEIRAYMRRHYRGAELIDRALRGARAALRDRRAPPAAAPSGAAERWIVVGDEVAPARPDALRDAPAVDLLAPFRLAQANGLAVGAAAVEAVRGEAARRDQAAWGDAAVAASFVDLLAAEAPAARALRAMHRAGLLVELLPELGPVTGLFLLDPYHDFAVDEHSLGVVAELDRAASSQAPLDRLRRAILADTRHRHVLRLAALLHDAGKGIGANHARVGANLTPDVARRLGLDLEAARLLRLLVAEHGLLTATSERRQADDPDVLAGLAKRVGYEEALDLLYCLTAADARAVGKHAFPNWRDTVVTSLYLKVRDQLREGGAPALDPAAHRRATVALLPTELDPAAYDRHLALAPRRYLVEVDPLEVALHLELVERVAAGAEVAITRLADGGVEHLWIATPHRAGLFAELAGAVASIGASVVAAVAYTRADGLALDKLTVAPPEERAGDPRMWTELEERIRDLRAGRRDPAELVAATARRIPASPPREGPAGPTAVVISNRNSDRYTVIEIATADRVGLLFDLARALTACGLEMHGARISTRGTRAADVFWVTRDGAKVAHPSELEALHERLSAV